MSEISDMTSVGGGTDIEDNSMVSNENITRTISTRNIREGNIGNHDKKESEAQLRPAQKEKATKALEVELVPSVNLEATRTNENITRTISTRNIREGNIGNHDRKESKAQLRPSQKEEAKKAIEVQLIPSANLEATRTNGKTVTDGYDESGDESDQEEQCYVDHEDIQNLMNFEKYDKM